MRRVKVYIASPFTNGDKEQNVRLQMDAMYHLLMMGFNPYMPLYHYFIQKVHSDLDHSIPWLEIDKEWLSHCDLAIRFHVMDKNGVEIHSPGADVEEDFCEINNIPMLHFYKMEDMVDVFKDMEKTID